MPKELKLYIVSILAIRPTTNDKGEPKNLFVHMPWIVEATDIDDAAQQACTEAGKWFPRDGGFIECDIAVDAVPKEYYERLTIFANLSLGKGGRCRSLKSNFQSAKDRPASPQKKGERRLDVLKVPRRPN